MEKKTGVFWRNLNFLMGIALEKEEDREAELQYQQLIQGLVKGETTLETHAEWLTVEDRLQISQWASNLTVSSEIKALFVHLICENAVWTKMLLHGLENDLIVFSADLED